jgi:hypothetical protein
MKVYITKYWQTEGVFQVEAETFDDTPGMCRYLNGKYFNYIHGRDWHKTIEAAQERFESLRAKKIAVMQAKINKLKNMKFEVMIK